MSAYTIYENKALLESGRPATHAIVIGIGEYFYLAGGRSGRVTKLNGGLVTALVPPGIRETIRTVAIGGIQQSNEAAGDNFATHF